MAKSDNVLKKEVRAELNRKGCKKIGYIDFLLVDKKIFLTFFTTALGKVETTVEIRYVSLNEFAFYLDEYGTSYNGRILVGEFPGELKIPNSLHVSGAASLGLFGGTVRHVLENEDVETFVATCLDEGSALLEKYRAMMPSLRASLEQNPPADYAITVATFVGEFQRARQIVESRREDDGGFLGHVPRQADRYLRDLGF
jgi:hypothetical protein